MSTPEDQLHEFYSTLYENENQQFGAVNEDELWQSIVSSRNDNNDNSSSSGAGGGQTTTTTTDHNNNSNSSSSYEIEVQLKDAIKNYIKLNERIKKIEEKTNLGSLRKSKNETTKSINKFMTKLDKQTVIVKEKGLVFKRNRKQPSQGIPQRFMKKIIAETLHLPENSKNVQDMIKEMNTVKSKLYEDWIKQTSTGKDYAAYRMSIKNLNNNRKATTTVQQQQSSSSFSVPTGRSMTSSPN